MSDYEKPFEDDGSITHASLYYDYRTQTVTLRDQYGRLVPRWIFECMVKHMRNIYDQFSCEAEIERLNCSIMEEMREKEKQWEKEWHRQLDYEERKRERKGSGYIYLLKSTNNYYKIGRTINMDMRMKQYDCHAPGPITLIHSFPVLDMVQAEKELHERFASKRYNGEWFALDKEDVAYICGRQS